MSEATQETETNQHPHRRLLVVDPHICKECAHRVIDDPGSQWFCKLGDMGTDYVTGETHYITLCRDKNENGDCLDFESNELEEAARHRLENRVVIAMLIALLAIFLFYFVALNGAHT